MGCEVEYSLSSHGNSQVRVRENRDRALCSLKRSLCALNRNLPDTRARTGCFLSNGGRAYLDQGQHWEMASPEVRTPLDVVVYERANERILEEAVLSCNTPFPFSVYKNNIDYRGNTFGMHENYSVRRRVALEKLRRLVPFLVTRQLYAGAGRISFDPRSCGFELSQRARFVCQEVSRETTKNRGIINTKDESLSGGEHQRIHLILGDSLRSELGSYLQVGTTALLIRLIEEGIPIGKNLALEQPVDAIRELSCNPSSPLALADGRTMSAEQIQAEYLEEAKQHAYLLPEWSKDVLDRWQEVLLNLEETPENLDTRLDFYIKRAMFDRFLSQHNLTWNDVKKWGPFLSRMWSYSAQLRSRPHLRTSETLEKIGESEKNTARILRSIITMLEMDIRYHDINREMSLFDILDTGGLLNHRIVHEETIVHAMKTPPKGTRAELRGNTIEALSRNARCAFASWTSITIPGSRVLDMENPYEATGTWREIEEGATNSDESSNSFIRRIMD